MNKSILGILGLFIFGLVISLVGSLTALMATQEWMWVSALAELVLLALSVGIGLIYGLLITKMKLQPFLAMNKNILGILGLFIFFGLVISLFGSLPALMVKQEWISAVAGLVLLALSVGIGLIYGLLITKMKLQPILAMNKNILGILGLFIFIFSFTAESNENFLSAYNQQNLLKWSSLYAIMGIGVAFVIITGGIDLSIGSVIGLVASLMALMVRSEWDPILAVLMLIGLSLGIGLVHGLLVTKMKLQPFVVTLCGLLFYRGISRWTTDNQSMGYSDTETLNSLFSGKMAIGSFGLPAPFFFLVVVAVLAAIFLNRTIWGRYLLALGNNEDGARYSGIETDRLKITAYVICSFLAGLSGLLFAYELDSVQPAQTGEFYELYAIAAAVLGGCSLRGGQGTILGVIIAAAVIRLLRNSINLLGISTHLEYAIIGMVILCGVSTDEIIKRIMAKRRAAK